MAITTEPAGVTQPGIGDTAPSLGGAAASFQAEILRQSQSGSRGGGQPIRLASAATLSAPLTQGVEFALPRLAPGALGALGTLATGAAAAVPLLVIPTNASHLQQGALPGHPDIGYRFYQSESGIRFYRINPNGSEGATLWTGPRSRIQREDGSLAVNVEALNRIPVNDPVGPIIGGGFQSPPIEGLAGPIGGGYQSPSLEGLDGSIGGGYQPPRIEGESGPIGGGYQSPPLNGLDRLPGLVPPEMPDTTILESRNFDKVDFNVNRLPQAQQEAVNATLAHINAGTRPTTPPLSTRWGAQFQNRNEDLPVVAGNGDPITYREYRVDGAPFGETDAGSRRIVVGSDGRVYFTGTHYGDNPGKPFVRIR